MKFYCIGDEETARGFRLAGVEGAAVGNEGEASAALEGAAGRADCGVIIITRAAAALVRARVEEIKLERAKPLIVEVDGPGAAPGLAGRAAYDDERS